MKTLYIHDNGEIICLEHAGYDLKYLVGQKPNARKHWTPHGTWEIATPFDFSHFKEMTGIDMECEECKESN